METVSAASWAHLAQQVVTAREAELEKEDEEGVLPWVVLSVRAEVVTVGEESWPQAVRI